MLMSCALFLLTTSTDLPLVLNRLKKIDHWQVQFEETVFSEKGVLHRKSGMIVFRTPLRFRIAYQNEYIVSDGEDLIFVFPDKKKVYVRKLKDSISEALVIQLLSGSDDILSLFEARKMGRRKYELVPKEGVIKNVERLILHTSDLGFPIERIQILLRNQGLSYSIRIIRASYDKIEPDLSFPNDFKVIRE